MKNKAGRIAGTIVAGIFISIMPCLSAYASDDGTFVTINVKETGDGDGMTYALDSTDPEAFTENSTFQVDNGSTHTIYVKDEDGKITERTYTGSTRESAEDEDKNTEVTVDVDLYSRSAYAGKDRSSYEAAGGGKEPAEKGGGTVYERTDTDGTDKGDKVFYTVTTKEGEVFYLVIDQTSGADNVYLLDQVTITDLTRLAKDNLDEAESEGSNALLSSLSDKPKEDNIDDLLLEDTEKVAKKEVKTGNPIVRFIVIFLLVGAAGGAYYYMKVLRNKKDEQMDLIDALDKDDFEVEDNRKEEKEDEVDWEYEDEDFEYIDDDFDFLNDKEYLKDKPDTYEGADDAYEEYAYDELEDDLK